MARRRPLRDIATSYAVQPGLRYPIGATWTRAGTNFSVFSRVAHGMELLLYADESAEAPLQVIRLDPRANRTFYFWHVFVEQLPQGVLYNWRVTRPDGQRLEVLDPWARAVSESGWDRARACGAGASRLGLRGAVVDTDYHWDGERRPARGLDGAVIYELHVGGFTRHPSSGVREPGTFAALIEKIPYLVELGVTHVQLMPVMAFDEQDAPAGVADLGLHNYWGYSPYAFCAPHPRYCVGEDRRSHARQFKDLVKALHDAGIGVILDVVFNHTAEGGAGGPVIHYKGLMDDLFYHRDPLTGAYVDYTGCGNTINANHPLVTQFIVRSLQLWVEEMHVDGFRFDLASIFARGEDGVPMRNPPLPWTIEFSRTLTDLPLIAEAWDAAGLYQVGTFPGLGWSEWNGRYRDVVRRFVRGDPGVVGELATCVAGSSDLYQPTGRPPASGINFVTCHDGFTLLDLVSYNEKHNEANGELNRDGHNENLSWNMGTEGETADPRINALRRQQARNFLAILMLSQGVPMLQAGDEVLRTQRGNNNAWCQNNELSWFDWRLTETNGDMLRFTRELIALRRRHPTLSRRHFLTGQLETGRDLPDISWHGRHAGKAPWSDPGSRYLALTLAALEAGEEDLHVIMNMSGQRIAAVLPVIAHRRWHVAVDTSRPSPEDIIPASEQRPLDVAHLSVAARSVVVLEARPA